MPAQTHSPSTDLILPLPEPGEQWDPHTIHTLYFGLSVPEAALGAYFYIRFQPAFPLCQGGACVFRGAEGNLRPLDQEFIDFQVTMPWAGFQDWAVETVNGLRIEFLEPGRLAHVTYRSLSGEVTADVMQEAATPLFARGHGMPGEDTDGDPGASPGGSEQIMHVTGELTVRGITHAVDCHEVRDRSWRQVRRETQGGAAQVPPIGWTPMYFGDDLSLSTISFEAPDTDPAWAATVQLPAGAPLHHHGWMLVDGESRSIARVHRDVVRYHPRGYHAVEQNIEIEDETGRVHRFHGEVVAATAVPAWPNLGYTVCVYGWTDEQGRVSHCTYQEAWDDAYQRAMGKRFA
jgi:hypothetical protein